MPERDTNTSKLELSSVKSLTVDDLVELHYRLRMLALRAKLPKPQGAEQRPDLAGAAGTDASERARAPLTVGALQQRPETTRSASLPGSDLAIGEAED